MTMGNYQQFELLKKSAVTKIAADLDQQTAERLKSWENTRSYDTVYSFYDGFTIAEDERQKVALFDGEWYRWDGELPKTVSAGSTPQDEGGIGSGAWLSVGDAALRSELADPDKGAAMVRGAVRYVSSIADLQALNTSGLVNGQKAFVTTTGKAGEFTWMNGDQSSSVSTDPLFGVYVPPASDLTGMSGAWVRRVQGNTYDAAWFGISPNSSDISDLESAMNSIPDHSKFTFSEEGVYDFGVMTGSTGFAVIRNKTGLHIDVAKGVELKTTFDVGAGADVGFLQFEDCDELTFSGGGKIVGTLIDNPPASRANFALLGIRPAHYTASSSKSPTGTLIENLIFQLEADVVYSPNYAGYVIRHGSQRHPRPKSKNVTVRNCTFDNCSGRIVQITNCDNCHVTDNKFINVGKGIASVPIRCIGSYSGLIVSGNTIFTIDGGRNTALIYVGTQDVNEATEKVGSSSDVAITGNTLITHGIQPSRLAAFRITASTNVVVSGNTALDPGKTNTLLDIGRTIIEKTYDEDLRDVFVSANNFSGWGTYFYENADLTGAENIVVDNNNDSQAVMINNNFLSYEGLTYNRYDKITRVFPQPIGSIKIPLRRGMWKLRIFRYRAENTSGNLSIKLLSAGVATNKIGVHVRRYRPTSEDPTSVIFGEDRSDIPCSFVSNSKSANAECEMIISNLSGRAHGHFTSAAFPYFSRGEFYVDEAAVYDEIEISISNGDTLAGGIAYELERVSFGN